MYLGELFRQVTNSHSLNLVYNPILLHSQVLLEAVDKRLLFPGVDVMPVLSQRDCLQTKHISAIEIDWQDNDFVVYDYFQDICCHILHKIGLELSFFSFWNSVMQILQWNSFPPAYIFNVIATLIHFAIGLLSWLNDKMMALTCG